MGPTMSENPMAYAAPVQQVPYHGEQMMGHSYSAPAGYGGPAVTSTYAPTSPSGDVVATMPTYASPAPAMDMMHHPPSYAPPAGAMEYAGPMHCGFPPAATPGGTPFAPPVTPSASYVSQPGGVPCGNQQPTVVFVPVPQPQYQNGCWPSMPEDPKDAAMRMSPVSPQQPCCWPAPGVGGFHHDPNMPMPPQHAPMHPSPQATPLSMPPPPPAGQPTGCWTHSGFPEVSPPPSMPRGSPHLDKATLQLPPAQSQGGWTCFSDEQRSPSLPRSAEAAFDKTKSLGSASEKTPMGAGDRHDKEAVELLEKTLQDALGIQPVLSVATPARTLAKGGKSGRDSERLSPKNATGDKMSPKSGSANALEDLMRRKGVDEAWNALEDMQRRGVTTDKFTVSRMLMKTLGDGRSRINPVKVYRGIALVERFIEQQPKDVDQVLINALLDTCCRLKDLSRLEATVQLMRNLKVAPSPVTLGILVKAYGQAGDLPKVLQVWDEMENQRGQANAVTYGCMIDACVKCGNLEKAVEIFNGMRESGKHRNTILYTTLIKGYGLEKDLEKVMSLFREMPHEGVPYNTITYNSAIDACVKCGDLATGEQLLNEMRQCQESGDLKPDLITYSTLLKGYCHVGELDKALQVVEAIKSSGLQCDELVYNTLMHGCVKASNLMVGVNLFEEMVKSGMRPSAITHSILVRLYQRVGYEDSAAATNAVAELYQHHGIERPSGSERSKGQHRRGGGNGGGGNGGGNGPNGTPAAAGNSPAFSPAYSPAAYSSAGYSPAHYSPSMTPTWYHNSPAIGFGALSLS